MTFGDLENVSDVGADKWLCRRSQRHDWHVLEKSLDVAQLLVIWSEIMPPLADAVRLIDDDALKPPITIALLHHIAHLLTHRKLFWCDVHQPQA